MSEILSLSVQELLNLTNSSVFDAISPALKKQLQEKLGFLSKAQIGYLPLNRPARYLSTGELKWIKLNSILSGNLSGMCIILDEPAAGLPASAQTLLVDILRSSCKNGNTILVSTHHKELLLAADRIIELGPGPGKAGGKIIADITPNQLNNYKNLVANDVVKNVSPTHEKIFDETSKNQIQEIQTANIYENAIHIITGASGSGKTQLLNKIAAEAKKLEHHTLIMANTKLPSGNSHSTIATRTGLLNDLKTVFAGVPDAASFKAADFSFNNKTGQCATCKGTGTIKTTLDFLPDVIETCSECSGSRYNEAILSVQYNGKNIGQWLQVTIEELINEPFWTEKSNKMLRFLMDSGLSYLTLGRNISTLSFGERRRLALAEQLATLKTRKAIICIDNATLGLDPRSFTAQVALFESLAKKGHTIIITDAENRAGAFSNVVRNSL
jgi:excinuclease ABC subunit A